MQNPELFLVFIRPLNTMEIPYMITGSMAAMIYGEPRFTHDIDLVINLKQKWINNFHQAFDNDNFYVPPLEVLNIEAARNISGHFNLLYQHTGFKADVYLKGTDELHAWAFNHRTKESINNENIWIAPPEYVILRKLMYYKEGHSAKHLEDIRSIMQHSVDILNFSVIEEKVDTYRLSETWNLINSVN